MSETDFYLKDESYGIIGCCMEVHSQLGCGFLEAIYQEALAIEFSQSGVPYQQQKELQIAYKGTHLEKKYIADFICYNKVIVEIKAVSELTDIHYAQLFNYLRATNIKLGLLFNFGRKSLQYKRIIL